MKCFNNDVSSPMYDYILTDYNCCSPLSGRLTPPSSPAHSTAGMM
jgi:hypothetical protein